jgi:MFS family permease
VRLLRQFLLVFAHVVSAFSAFGGILFGYDTGVISGIKVMKPWLDLFGSTASDGSKFLPSSHESLVVSILSAGTFFGALLGAPVADYIGRKWVRITSFTRNERTYDAYRALS